MKNNNLEKTDIKLIEIFNKIEEISKSKTKSDRKMSEHNIFKILRMEDFEIRHSNFLAWLFDCKTNGAIKQNFTILFLKLLKKKCKNNSQVLDDLINNLKEDYCVKREDKFKDIMFEFQNLKCVIVIENKIYSTEHNNQLKRYYDEVQKNEKFADYNKFFCYLTLNGDEPIDSFDKQTWVNVSYEEILQILLKLKETVNLKNEPQLILNNYIEILEEKTEKTMNRIKEYFKLYENNKEVVTEMLEYMPNIKQRAKLEKDYINNNKNLTLLTKNANVFLNCVNNDLVEFLKQNNLPQNLFIFGISNEPYNKMQIYIEMLKGGDYYNDFQRDFGKAFNKSYNIKEGNYFVLFTKNYVSSNEHNYLTEKQFQEKILESLEDFFENINSEYFEILSFIKNFNFKK